MRIGLKFAAGTMALALTSAVPALSQTAGATVLVSPTTTVTDGSWTVTLSGCIQKPSGGGAASCNGTDEVVPTISGNSLSLVFSSFSGNTIQPLETASFGQTPADLSFSSITATYSGASISAVFVNVSGSASGGALASNVTVNSGTISGVGSGVTTNLGNSQTLQTATFAPSTPVTLSGTDIGTNAHLAPSGSLTMNTATIGFTKAPEPVSTSILAVGIAGLGFVRRKTRRTK